MKTFLGLFALFVGSLGCLGWCAVRLGLAWRRRTERASIFEPDLPANVWSWEAERRLVERGTDYETWRTREEFKNRDEWQEIEDGLRGD